MRPVEEHQRVVAGLIGPRAPAAVQLERAEGLALAEDVPAPQSLPGTAGATHATPTADWLPGNAGTVLP